MPNDDSLKFVRAVVGHPDDTVVIASREDAALIFDAVANKLVRSLPLETDTDGRVAFGPKQGTCLIGSWRKDLKFWNFVTGHLLWSNPITKIDGVNFTGASNPIKIKKEGTVFLDPDSGTIVEGFKYWDIFRSPFNAMSASFDDVHKRVVLRKSPDSQPIVHAWPSFAILSAAWSPTQVMLSSPGEYVAIYSFENEPAKIISCDQRWFNMRQVAYQPESKKFFGMASDWKGLPGFGLVSVNEGADDINLVAELENKHGQSFFNRGHHLVLSDGSVFSTETGQLLHRLNFQLGI